MPVPYTFGTATAAIPLSQLDSNFSTAVTIGNTAVQLGNTVTTLNNITLANVTVSSGNSTVTKETVTTITSPTATNLTLQSAGTTAVTIDTSQNVTMANRTTNPTTISVGGATPSTSGSGITFPATQSSSSDVNTLDDYEEGTFTPTFSTSSGALGSTSNVSGAYIKVGSLVTLSISFQITNIGTAAGAGVNILSLPFSGTANRFAGVSREIAVSGTGGTVYFNGSTSLSLNTAVAGSPVGTNNYWLTSISYFTT